VNALVADLVADYHAMAVEKQINVELEPGAAHASMSGDPARLRHILDNLMSNAVKYTPAGGVVRVHVADGTGDGSLRIEVRDSGPGVPPHLRERVFEEFFRVDPGDAAIAGHGVGLSISRRLSRGLGGDITIGDAPEGGAAFTLCLPAQPLANGRATG
jgi:signal transduction histidine kinase